MTTKPEAPPYEVEVVFRVRVDYDLDDWLSATDTILKYGTKLDSCEVMEGNACCHPYVLAEHNSQRVVTEFAEKVVRYIRRRKGGRLNP